MTVPLWLAIPVLLLAAWAVHDHLLAPGVRWFLRRRLNRALEEVNRRLQIRLQPFKLTKRQVLIDRLLYDAEVMGAAERHAEGEQMPRQVVMARVERYAREIVPSFNAYIYFRVGYWIARRVAQALYRVRLGALDEKGLASLPADATVVFVMNHRSNFDYILVSYLVAERTALSYAVGEWARIWPLETLIRSMGAYFVRRGSRDALYRTVLARYVAMATREGVTQALYPEGGLSRDGRLRRPKLGLLDYMLRDFDPAGRRDLIFIPVGINYDRVLEDRTLLLDLDPGARRRTGLAAALTTLGFLARNLRLLLAGRWYRFGYACVNLGSPVSMRRFLEERSVDPRRLGRGERFALVEELAGHLMDRVAERVPVLPVAVVASVLERHRDRALSELEVKAEVQRRFAELEASGMTVYVPRRDREYAVQVGLRMLTLRHLAEEREGLYRPRPEELPLLRYYANSIPAPSS